MSVKSTIKDLHQFYVKQLNSLFHNLVYKWFITIITSDKNKYRNNNCEPIKSKTSKAT